MPLDPALWSKSEPDWCLPGVTANEFQAFEGKNKVELPALMKELYSIQNGGMLRDVDDVYLCPLGKPLGWLSPMSSLMELVGQRQFMDADDLEFVEEEFGDAGRIICFALSYGHVMDALNYNHTNSQGEPEVISLANDGGGHGTESESFAAWFSALTGTEAEAALDWSELEQYPLLFKSTFDAIARNGSPAVKDCVLCRDGDQGLILFERTQSDGRTIEIQRASLPEGIDQTWLQVAPFGNAGNLASLHLQPVETEDIHWVTSELRSNGEWKIERSRGVPIYALLLSQDQPGLRELARTLQEQGFFQERPPVRIPPEFEGAMAGLLNFGQTMMQAMQKRWAGEDETAEDLPTKTPVAGGDTARMTRQDVVEEISEIVRFYASKVRQVQTADDAEQMIADFEPHTRRYVQLLRALNPSGNVFMAMAELAPAEATSREALRNLQSRSNEAHRVLKQHEQSVVMEALRPEVSGRADEELLRRIKIAGATLADLLESVNRDKSVGAQAESLQAAVQEYIDSRSTVLTSGVPDQAPKGPFSLMMPGGADLTKGIILVRWQREPTYARLRKAWDELRVQRRELFKEHREIFQPLSDAFI